MRIIGGRFGGRRLKVNIPEGTRPTTDSIKETIFNIIYNYIDIENTICADLFAGSGSLGIEAISRGVSTCYFVDRSGKSCSVISNIAGQLNIDKIFYNIIKKDVIKYLIGCNKTFSLIFIDPPYQLSISNNVIDIINRKNLLFKDGLIVSEHGINESLVLPESMEIIRSKKTGTTIVDFIINK